MPQRRPWTGPDQIRPSNSNASSIIMRYVGTDGCGMGGHVWPRMECAFLCSVLLPSSSRLHRICLAHGTKDFDPDGLTWLDWHPPRLSVVPSTTPFPLLR